MWFARLMCCMSGSSSTALCARNAHNTLYDVATWSWVNLVNPDPLEACHEIFGPPKCTDPPVKYFEIFGHPLKYLDRVRISVDDVKLLTVTTVM